MTALNAPLNGDVDRYARTYRKHPRLLAERITEKRAKAQAARQAGDQRTATQYEDQADQLEAARRHLGTCRACGRPLEDPASVDRGVGPSCWRKGLR